MSAEVKFIEGEPPPVKYFRGKKSGKWMRIADQLKEQPGVWAEVDRGDTTFNSVNSGFQLLRKHGCETIRRKNGTDEVVLYARWPA
jgi:hypothetical protein